MCTDLCLAYVHVFVTTCAYVAEEKARPQACAYVCVRMRIRVCMYEPSVCARMCTYAAEDKAKVLASG